MANALDGARAATDDPFGAAIVNGSSSSGPPPSSALRARSSIARHDADLAPLRPVEKLRLLDARAVNDAF
jgi:hypothetical protein